MEFLAVLYWFNGNFAVDTIEAIDFVRALFAHDVDEFVFPFPDPEPCSFSVYLGLVSALVSPKSK